MDNWLCYVRQMTPTVEEKEALDTAATQRKELQILLENDSALQNPLESILETEIRIPEYMCSEDFLRQIQEDGRPNKVSCEGIMDLMNDEWVGRIKTACSKEKISRNGQPPDQVQRESRFAGYQDPGI